MACRLVPRAQSKRFAAARDLRRRGGTEDGPIETGDADQLGAPTESDSESGFASGFGTPDLTDEDAPTGWDGGPSGDGTLPGASPEGARGADYREPVGPPATPAKGLSMARPSSPNHHPLDAPGQAADAPPDQGEVPLAGEGEGLAARSWAEGGQRSWAVANRPAPGASRAERRKYYSDWVNQPALAEEEGELRRVERAAGPPQAEEAAPADLASPLGGAVLCGTGELWTYTSVMNLS